MAAGTAKTAPKFRSIKQSHTAAFLLMSTGVLLLVGGLQAYLGFSAQQTVIAKQQQMVADDAAGAVRDFIQTKTDILKTSSSIGRLSTLSKEDQGMALKTLFGIERSFRQLLLFDAQDREIHRISRMSKAMSGTMGQFAIAARTEMFVRTKHHEDFISRIYMDEITNEPMVEVAVPVSDVFGDYQGTLLAEMNLKFMWKLVADLKIGRGGVAYVVDDEGGLLAFQDVGRVLKRERLTHLREVRRFVQGDVHNHKSSAIVSKGILGSLTVANHSHIGIPNWAMVVELPAMEAYETVIYGVGVSAIALVLSAVGATLIGIYLSNRFTTPILNLTAAAKQISNGNWGVKVEVESQNELGQLANAIARMVQDLKTFQAQLVQSGKLAGLGELSAGIAHELNQPITSVRAFIELLRADGECRRPHNIDALNRIFRATERMSSIIDNLRRFARQSDLDPKPCPAPDPLERALELVSEQLRLHDIRVETDFDADLPKVMAEEIQLQQVFLNLLSNARYALDSLDAGGTAGATKRLLLSIHAEGPWVTYMVEDNGPGISTDKVGQIFDPFFTSKPPGEGMGLGLSISYGIVKSHGGEIRFEQVPVGGARFIVRVPTAPHTDDSRETGLG